MVKYPYLSAERLNSLEMSNIFGDESSWVLERKPKVGFYLDFIRYQEDNYMKMSQREVGRVIFSIDPWMKSSMNENYPLNAYRKITRLKHQNLDLDIEIKYPSGKLCTIK